MHEKGKCLTGAPKTWFFHVALCSISLMLVDKRGFQLACGNGHLAVLGWRSNWQLHDLGWRHKNPEQAILLALQKSRATMEKSYPQFPSSLRVSSCWSNAVFHINLVAQ